MAQDHRELVCEHGQEVVPAHDGRKRADDGRGGQQEEDHRERAPLPDTRGDAQAGLLQRLPLEPVPIPGLEGPSGAPHPLGHAGFPED